MGKYLWGTTKLGENLFLICLLCKNCGRQKKMSGNTIFKQKKVVKTLCAAIVSVKTYSFRGIMFFSHKYSHQVSSIFRPSLFSFYIVACIIYNVFVFSQNIGTFWGGHYIFSGKLTLQRMGSTTNRSMMFFLGHENRKHKKQHSNKLLSRKVPTLIAWLKLMDMLYLEGFSGSAQFPSSLVAENDVLPQKCLCVTQAYTLLHASLPFYTRESSVFAVLSTRELL